MLRTTFIALLVCATLSASVSAATYKQLQANVAERTFDTANPTETSDYALEEVSDDGIEVPVNDQDHVVIAFTSDDESALDDVEIEEPVADEKDGNNGQGNGNGGGNGRGRGPQRRRLRDVPDADHVDQTLENGLRTRGVDMKHRMARGNNKYFKRRGSKVVSLTKFQGGRKLEVATPKKSFAGEPTTIKARFLDRDGSVCADCLSAVTFTPKGGDAVAGADTATDGWWSADVTLDATTHVRVVADSTAGDHRTLTTVVRVAERSITSINGAVLYLDEETQEVSLTLSVSARPNAGRTYLVKATIKGNGEDIVFASGLADLVDGTHFTLVIQPEWFEDKSGPYTVEDVEILCIGTHIVVASVDSLPASYSEGFHPLSSKRSHLQKMIGGKSETAVERQTRITVGRKPNKEGVKSGTHRKLLIHGYCASSNPFPTSHFSNADSGFVLDNIGSNTKNETHVTFAQAIDTYATSKGYHGCGIIAHSQGGAAALSLYAFYWSCLDYAEFGGTRLIQSVGTPYQGTSLAGSLADLGGLFGVGCGSNTDLTYSGASAWLSGIPSWARSQVNYYTTSFNDRWWAWDYCNFFSDLVLSDPDDGTTERQYGQLSGANNRGHKEGQCHTTGMRDPAQYLDSSRNSQMNSNALY